MLGFQSAPPLTVTYGSCGHGLLPEWNLDFQFDGGTARLGERFLPVEDFNDTGLASLESAEVFLAGRRQRVTRYWDLVYASGLAGSNSWTAGSTGVSAASASAAAPASAAEVSVSAANASGSSADTSAASTFTTSS